MTFPKLSFIPKFFIWIGGLLEDQMGSASAKRACLYIFSYFEYLLVQGMLAGKEIDHVVLYMVSLVVLFCVGAITSEFFKDGLKAFFPASNQDTVVKTVIPAPVVITPEPTTTTTTENPA